MKSENRKLTQKVRSKDQKTSNQKCVNNAPNICYYLGYIYLNRSCREIRPSIVKNIIIINNSIERKSLASK